MQDCLFKPTKEIYTSATIDVKVNFASGREKSKKIGLEAPFASGIIDPDWPYTVAPGRDSEELIEGDKGRLSGFTRNREESKNKYRQKVPLTIDELSALPIKRLIGGYVFLWTVGPFLINGSAQRVIEAWGFVPSSILTWAKYDTTENHGYGGVGYWFLGNAEFCIVAKNPEWPSIRTGKSSLIVEKKKRHSEKPDSVHEICEQRFPGPYVELYGRRHRNGWTVLGNEAPNDGLDIRDSIGNILRGN